MPGQVFCFDKVNLIYVQHTHTHTHLLLLDMVSRKVYIHSILVVHQPTDPSHGCVEQTFLLIEGSLLLSIWQRTGVRQEVHVCHLKVPNTCGATPHTNIFK